MYAVLAPEHAILTYLLQMSLIQKYSLFWLCVVAAKKWVMCYFFLKNKQTCKQTNTCLHTYTQTQYGDESLFCSRLCPLRRRDFVYGSPILSSIPNYCTFLAYGASDMYGFAFKLCTLGIATSFAFIPRPSVTFKLFHHELRLIIFLI